MDWNMNLNNDQVWTLVIGILFGISELLGMFKRGPNGILHGAWKFYNLKVDLEYDVDGDDEDIGDGEEVGRRVQQTNLPNRETIVLEASKSNQNVDPNVLLIGNKKSEN
jgi:hypothetical protein